MPTRKKIKKPAALTITPGRQTAIRSGNELFLNSSGARLSTQAGRRFRELVSDFIADHVQGEPSAAEIAIARRAAQLALWCEKAEGRSAAEKTYDVDKYQRVANSLRRLLESLAAAKLGRSMKNITPSLDEYCEAKGYSR